MGRVIVPGRELGLDFVNTVSWRGSEPADSLGNIDDLLRWCEGCGILGAEDLDHARNWYELLRTKGVAIHAQAILIREAIYRILLAIARNQSPAAADLTALNGALERAPVRRRLAQAGKSLGWMLESVQLSAAAMLAPVLWSAGDLIVGAEAAHLRHCANSKCLWLFLDYSKNGSRRWCSMQSCGNRAKAHRHYLRLKER
jgi:predicted RNA-binding Zn ribbon-like protein